MMNILRHTQTPPRLSKLRTKALKLTLGASLLAVLAAGATVFAPNSNQTAYAATPATAPVSPSLINGIPPIATGGPHITGLQDAREQPAGSIGIDGTGFGTSDSATVYLEWTNVMVNNVYTQHGILLLHVPDWQDTHVDAQVPPFVEGVPDQVAHVVLTTLKGRAQWDIKFMATRVVVPLTSQSAKVTVNCSGASDSDTCADLGLETTHSDYGPYNLGVQGTDRYQVRLANGWMYWQLNLDNQGGTTVLQKNLVKGDTTFGFSVDWYFSGWDTEANYILYPYVYGPKGVPMK
jgi:hypothetical protein